MNKYTTVIKHEHKQGKSLVFYVIMTPFPFYRTCRIFQADLFLLKMGLYWSNFSLVFLIHLFLYAGVYCNYYCTEVHLNESSIKRCYTAKCNVKPWSHNRLITDGSYPGFCIMKQLGVFLLHSLTIS